MRITSLFAAALALVGSALISHAAIADDSSTQKSSDAVPTTGTDTTKGSSSTESVMDQSQNNRQKTLEGSKSPFSLQFNLTYNGSTINHPFAKEVPNPELSVPPPLVSLSGTFSARYRLDPSTSVGIGLGLTTYQPFQGPKNTSVANPYTDLSHTWKLGVIKNRADFQFLVNTDQQTFSDLGYRVGLTALNEAFYEFKFGLTVGLLLELDYNFFSSDAKYAPLGIEQEETQWDFVTDPYFEYALNDTFNLRSVIGIQSFNNKDRSGDFDMDHLPVYQSFGVGTQVAKPFFLYTYVSGAWNNLGTDSVLFGMNAIFNIL